MELAAFASDFFHLKELCVLHLSLFFGVFAACKLHLLLKRIGRFIRRLTLEGSMGFFLTAVITFSLESGSESEHTGIGTSYDVFPSYSDASPDTAVVNEVVVPFLELQGLKVFARDRDGHPGNLELRTISDALENSRRFLIFLSSAYFGDRFRNDFEAAMIFETLCDRSPEPKEILLIRLDQCEIPVWLRQFPVHDRTASNLTQEDHLHNLLKWMEPEERKGTFRSPLDLLMTFLPVTAVATVLLGASYSGSLF